MEDIDKDSTKSHLTTEKLQKLNSVGESVSKSGFLTDDKLKSIMTFLDEVQTSDRLSSVDQVKYSVHTIKNSVVCTHIFVVYFSSL